MKDAIRQIVGKTISGVIVKRHNSAQPSSQVYLLFSDGTHYELYANGADIKGAGGIDHGDRDKVLSIGREGTKVILDTE